MKIIANAFYFEISELQDTGTKVAGVYCLLAPVELIRAAGAIPVSLCGKKEKPIADAERVLPSNLCPLIKSSYGYAITGTCPYFSASDFLIAETTCDGKKKMYEFLGRIKPLHLMHLPYSSDEPQALHFWYQEVLRLGSFIEKFTGHKIEGTISCFRLGPTTRFENSWAEFHVSRPLNVCRFQGLI